VKAKMGDVGVLLLVGGLGLVGYAILSRPKPVGETTLSMVVKERVITGAYQACRKECALRFWLAKTVFCSQTNGRITDLRFRYRLEYEHDTSAFQDIYSCAPLLAAWVSPADPPSRASPLPPSSKRSGSGGSTTMKTARRSWPPSTR